MRLTIREYRGRYRSTERIEREGPTCTVEELLPHRYPAGDGRRSDDPGSGHVLRNGTTITSLNDGRTALHHGDEVTILSGVAGGGHAVVERTFRGISTRAAVHYLTTLGGEAVAEGTVEGERWRAEISADRVTVGPTLELTEVTVRFEGDHDVLDPLTEAFARKAIRAGG